MAGGEAPVTQAETDTLCHLLPRLSQDSKQPHGPGVKPIMISQWERPDHFTH